MPVEAAPRLFPLEPLLAVARQSGYQSRIGAGWGALVEVCKLSGSELVRARDEGLTDRQADRCAVRLGYHPCEIWPEWFDGDGAGSRVDVLFAWLRRDLGLCKERD